MLLHGGGAMLEVESRDKCGSDHGVLLDVPLLGGEVVLGLGVGLDLSKLLHLVELLQLLQLLQLL